MNFIDEVVASRNELEAPLSFWYWSALSTISAVVKDNVYLNRQIYNLYPNIYVMFHAESGLKKGAPVAMASKFVQAVNNTRIIVGRSSIQGILKDMGQSQTVKGGKPVMDSSVFICSSELTSSIVEDKVAADILTDLYDRQWRVGEWRSLLKMETFKLNNPTVTMLTATNEAHASDFFSRKDVHGGYFARTFIIYESVENRVNSLLLPLKNPPDDTKSISYLKELGKVKGAFKPLGQTEEDEYYCRKWIDPDTHEVGYLSEAGLLYQEWYYNFKHESKSQLVKDETGTQNRFGDSVLKVAMLLSLARSIDLEISKEAMEETLRVCEKLIGNVRQTSFGARGMSDASPLKAKLIMELLMRDNNQISRPMLMKKYWMHYADVKELDELMLALNESGMIDILTMGNQIVYKMVDSQVKEFQRFFSGKSVRGK